MRQDKTMADNTNTSRHNRTTRQHSTIRDDKMRRAHTILHSTMVVHRASRHEMRRNITLIRDSTARDNDHSAPYVSFYERVWCIVSSSRLVRVAVVSCHRCGVVVCHVVRTHRCASFHRYAVPSCGLVLSHFIGMVSCPVVAYHMLNPVSLVMCGHVWSCVVMVMCGHVWSWSCVVMCGHVVWYLVVSYRIMSPRLVSSRLHDLVVHHTTHHIIRDNPHHIDENEMK